MFLGLEISRREIAAILAKPDGAAELALRQDLSPNVGAASHWLVAMELCESLLIRAALEPAQIERVGVSFEAPLSENGVVLKDPQSAGWEGYDLPRAVAEHLKIGQTIAAPRAICEALGEAQFGALRGAQNWLYVHLGRDVESAAALGGQIVRGASLSAGDIGGICIERDSGAMDSDGRRGSLSAYCGGEAFLAKARSYGLTFQQAHQIWEMAGQNFSAQSLVEDFTARLAQGLGAALAMLNPAQICIGGGLGDAIFDKLKPPLWTKLREVAPPRAFANLQIVPAQLGEDSAALGAVALALRGKV